MKKGTFQTANRRGFNISSTPPILMAEIRLAGEDGPDHLSVFDEKERRLSHRRQSRSPALQYPLPVAAPLGVSHVTGLLKIRYCPGIADLSIDHPPDVIGIR